MAAGHRTALFRLVAAGHRTALWVAAGAPTALCVAAGAQSRARFAATALHPVRTIEYLPARCHPHRLRAMSPKHATPSSNSDLLVRVDAATPAMKDRLVEWANINSGSHNSAGLLEMASQLNHALRDLQAEVKLVPLPDADAPAVVAAVRTGAPVRVLLSGHFDTVYGENDPFQSCQEPEPDILRGPGVADMKGGLVVMLEALRALESHADAQNIGWDVILTPDEETGSLASAPLLREAAARNHIGIVFEPALPDGSIIGTRKGVGAVRVTAHGRAAHAGRDFAQGRNAIVALAHFISAVNLLNHALKDVVVNAGKVSGGGAVNMVAEHAAAVFNVRAFRATDGEELLRRMRDTAEAVSRANEVRIEVSGSFFRPPMEGTPAATKLASVWCDVARSLGVAIAAGHSGGGSDGNILAGAGLPCIDGAGVEGGELHSDREWMRPSSLARRAKIAALFLLRLATGEIIVPEVPSR